MTPCRSTQQINTDEVGNAGNGCSVLSACTSWGGAASRAGAHAPPGESEERTGSPDQRDEQQTGGS